RAQAHRPRVARADLRLPDRNPRHAESLRDRRRRHPRGAADGDRPGRRLPGAVRARDPGSEDRSRGVPRSDRAQPRTRGRDAAPPRRVSAAVFEDWHAIQTLLMTYAEHIDAGRFAAAAAMFEHATYRVERDGQPDLVKARGAAQVEEFFAITRLHSDG